MKNLVLEKLASLLPPNSAGAAPEILTDGSLTYNVKRQVNNTKFQFRPSAIVLVETTAQVAEIVRFANRFPAEIVLRVRSGGHDHEGECSGTDTLLIDFSKMHAISVDWLGTVDAKRGERKPIVSVQPGARFERIKPVLDAKGIGIAHGTCETVGIAGYTMGGGWGPWTRRYGMGCERLIGATIVLGNGDIKTLCPDAPAGSEEARLLWALRGGGGFSYGIVTELKFAAFDLPDYLCSFNLRCIDEWPRRAALEIIQRWEKAIDDKDNTQLIGTNLKVLAINLTRNEKPNPQAILDCTFNGYFAGTEQDARKMIKKYFGAGPLPHLLIQVHRSPATKLAAAVNVGQWHFDSWDRHVPSKLKLFKQLVAAVSNGNAANAMAIREGIELEPDGPAPHKITSRLVNGSGWDDEGRKALICSLQSPMVPTQNDTGVDGLPNDFALNCYITLGAITGPFYANYTKDSAPPSAFPYKDRRFTIQYQAWWNQYLDTHGLPKKGITAIENDVLANRAWINRAEDWIEACRDYAIPHTGGAFISFKDSAVRTATYFSSSYQDLVRVKEDCSKDKNVLFRTRKTII
jgi:hypothetical protein